MKLIGKNSLSTVISWILFGLFILFCFHFLYEIVGHAVLLYKFKTGSDIFGQTFILGKDVGWVDNKWTSSLSNELKFRINYPFTEIQLVTGLYEPRQIFGNFFAFLYFTLVFYFAFKCFREFSSERFFSDEAVSNLKKLGYLNIIFAAILLFGSLLYYQMSAYALLQIVIIGFFGILVLFMVTFFKKGVELQSDNDLTI